MLWKPALLLAGLGLAGWALRSGLGREALNAPAQLGPAGFVAVSSVAIALGVPRQLAAYAAGSGFGLWIGGALVMLAQLLSCAIAFFWARIIARAWVARRMGGRLARIDAALARRPFSTTLTLRLLPLGSNIALNMIAGVSGVAFLPFLAASALGYIPLTAIFLLLGSGIAVGHGTQIGIAVALFVVASALGIWLLRRRPVS